MRAPLITALLVCLVVPLAAASTVPVVAIPRLFVDASNDQTGKNLWLSSLMAEHVAFRLSAAAITLVRYTDSLPALSDVRVTAQFEPSRDGRSVALYSEMNSAAIFEVTFPIERFGIVLDSLSGWILAKASPQECVRLDRFMRMQVESADIKALRESGRFCALALAGDRPSLMQAAEGALALYDVDALNQVTRFTAGVWLDNAGEWPRAYKTYAEQLVVIPEHAGLYAVQARCARRMGNGPAALAAARAAEMRNLKTPELLLEGVLALEKQGKKEGAYRIVADMMAKDSTCAGCWLFMARWYLDKGQAQLGLAAAERAMGLGAIDRDVVLQQGRALVALKRPAEAEAALLRSTTDPVLAREAWPILAELNAEVGKSAKALRYYEEAMKADPSNLQIYFKAADCAAATGDKADALRMLELARGRFAGSAELDRRIALVNLSAGDTAQVVRFLEQSLAKKADDTASILSLCRVFAGREQWPKLQTLSARLIALSPAHPEALRMLALAQLRTGDCKASIATLSPYVKKVPVDFAAVALLAESWYKMGNIPEAVMLYKKVLVNGGEGALAAGAADAFFAAGDMAQSVKWYDAAGKYAADPVRRLRLIAALSQLRLGDRAARRADRLTAPILPREPSLKAAAALEKNNDIARAARFYEAANAVGFGREEALTALLRIELREKKYASAAGRAMALALLDPVRQREQLYVAGTLYEQALQIQQAVTAYDRYLGSGAATVDGVLRLARIKGGLNDQAAVVRCASLVKPAQVTVSSDLLLFGNALLAAGRAADALTWFKECSVRFADVAGGWEGLALA